MVIIAAAVCTKAGKTMVSRQFLELNKLSIESLLEAFPKLMCSGKQHTFVENGYVRYVYQPMEKLYMLLITTKTSNIISDCETLRLFVQVVSQYCKSLNEVQIAENAFYLIWAFDEIVALGYREDVDLAKIHTSVEMNSDDERVYQAVRNAQEREAKNKMREKAEELRLQQMKSNKRGFRKSPGFGGGYGSYGSRMSHTSSMDDSSYDTKPCKSSCTLTPKPISAKPSAMKLGKIRDVESFVKQLKEEEETMTTVTSSSKLSTRNNSNIAKSHQILDNEILDSVCY